MGSYVFDNAWEKERERLSALERYFDPGTIRVLDSIGIDRGWSCLEVAGGGGSIARWLAHQVGIDGRVVATDIDTRFLEALTEANLHVLRHDIIADELPEESFDLIHARLLLEHLPSRDVLLKKLVSALRPGGWIVVEDLDWGPLFAKPSLGFVHPASIQKTSQRVARRPVQVMEAAGYDAMYGRRLPGELLECGLVDVHAEARDRLMWGGSPEAEMRRWTLERVRPAMTAKGGISARALNQELANLANPSNAWRGLLLVAVWGRRLGKAESRTFKPGLVSEAQAILDHLRIVPLFADCSPVELETIASAVREVPAKKGAALTKEGAEGSSFFIIGRGTATVTRKGKHLAQLGPGSFFGEVALLTEGVRTATVTADGPMTLYELDASGFRDLMRRTPAVAQKVIEGLARRLQRADEEIALEDEPFEYPRYF
jgi:SAM-dependent methyltransferase